MSAPQQPTITGYSKTAIGLHWIIALLIVAAFGLGLIMTDKPFSPTILKYYSWHKWLGVTVFAFAVIRVLWRMTHAAPALPSSMPKWQQLAAHGLHWALYALIFIAPLSGYFYSLAAGVPVVYLGLFPLPVLIDPNPTLAEPLQALHSFSVYLMAALVGLHVLAALKHHFIDHDGVLARMLPFLR